MEPSPPQMPFVAAVDKVLLSTVDDLDSQAPADPAFGGLFDRLRDLVEAGGKRMRPQFCFWGYRAAGGDGHDAIAQAGAALELVHMCALVHDDVMDQTPTRRGRPTVHEVFTDEHRSRQWMGDPAHFGVSGAIMVGDLALVVADAVFAAADFPSDQLAAAHLEYDHMRVEVTLGQYLDLVEGNRREASPETSLTIASLKTSKYTVERPLRIGAALAHADEATLGALSQYGRPVGLAFQLRDDLLGAFGDESVTGKPVGIDFREGKQTYLVGKAHEKASAAVQNEIEALLGDPDLDMPGVETLQTILRETGAVAASETLIASLAEEALVALDAAPITDEARHALAQLAEDVAFRDR